MLLFFPLQAILLLWPLLFFHVLHALLGRKYLNKLHIYWHVVSVSIYWKAVFKGRLQRRTLWTFMQVLETRRMLRDFTIGTLSFKLFLYILPCLLCVLSLCLGK